MYSSLLLILWGLSASTSGQDIISGDPFFNFFFGAPMPCDARLIGNYEGVELSKCTPSSDYDGVTQAAEIKSVDLKLYVIRSTGKPGVLISFEATSPTSLQVYRVKVHSQDGKIYCGLIHSSKPTTKILHRISLYMSCTANNIAPSIAMNVSVSSTSESVSESSRTVHMEIPQCFNSNIMIHSNMCAAYRKYLIIFNLRQVGNGLMVSLDKSSAYRGNKTTKIRMELLKAGDGMNGFVNARKQIALTYPTTRYIYTNLTFNEPYTLLIWRSTDMTQFSGKITLKSNTQRMRRHAFRLS